MAALSPRQRVAQILEDSAIELDGASNRLRALGLSMQAEQVAKTAMSLAVVTRSLIGKPSEALALYFGVGEDSAKEVAESMLPEDIGRAVQPGGPALPQPSTDAPSASSTTQPHRVPLVPVRVPMQLINQPVSAK